MAVYTQLSTETLAGLIARYDVGTLVSAKGIAEGVSNSNWLIETTKARYILTMYERRIDVGELPFFLDLLDHLASEGCPVPGTVHTRSGETSLELDGKALALIEFLPGTSPGNPTPEQAFDAGQALAGVHRAGGSFPQSRPNPLGSESWAPTLAPYESRLHDIDEKLPPMVDTARALATTWPNELPASICHTDLFPDNVLMLGDRVTGLIDFYFACTEAMAYDLAVTHVAWCFDAAGVFRRDVGNALIAGYETARTLSEQEREAMPKLAQGAAMRFIVSRAVDWIETPPTALVTRKDPMDFVRRLQVYEEMGDAAFPWQAEFGTR